MAIYARLVVVDTTGQEPKFTWKSESSSSDASAVLDVSAFHETCTSTGWRFFQHAILLRKTAVKVNTIPPVSSLPTLTPLRWRNK